MAAWTAEQDLHDTISHLDRRREMWARHGDPGAPRVAEIDAELADLTDRLPAATRRITNCLHEPALQALNPDRIAAEHVHWREDRHTARLAARQAAALQEQAQRTRHHQPPAPYLRPPDRGPGIGR